MRLPAARRSMILLSLTSSLLLRKSAALRLQPSGGVAGGQARDEGAALAMAGRELEGMDGEMPEALRSSGEAAMLSDADAEADSEEGGEEGKPEGKPARALTAWGERDSGKREAVARAGDVPFRKQEKPGEMTEYHMFEDIFKGGDGKHHSYRIPSIVSVGGGRLIAFAEGRLDCAGDYGNVNLVYKFSDDHGGSWSALRYLAGTNDGTRDTWGNPTAVYEKPWTGGSPFGRVHLFFNYNDGDFHEHSHPYLGCPKSRRAWRPVRHGDRQTYYVYSDDAGESWSPRRNFTEQLLPAHLKWDAAGPGVGIQKLFEPNKSMLVIPAKSRNFISSDHGATWTFVLATSNKSQLDMSESTVAECQDGRLYRNDRPGLSAFRSRYTLYYDRPDRPATETSAADSHLQDPKSQASLLTFAPDMLLFLNSDDTRSRFRLTVRLSRDCGKTWPIKRVLYPDDPRRGSWVLKGGYSSMAKAGPSHVAALSEATRTDKEKGIRSIDLVRFDMNWLCQDESYCRGVACTVSRGGTASDGSLFEVPQSCVEDALGRAFNTTAEATESRAATVQQRRNGSLMWQGEVKISPTSVDGTPTGYCGGYADRIKSSWIEGDTLLFQALRTRQDRQ